MTQLVRIERLDPREYEHPFDRRALDALEKTGGFEIAVRKFLDLGVERIWRIQFTGSNLKVTSSSLPDLFEVLEEACDTLSLQAVPEFYLQRSDVLRGVTVGVSRPLIVLSTECVECLSREELLFVLGHEIGHIKSQHQLYHGIGVCLPAIADALAASTLGVSSLVSVSLRVALAHWVRMSEYTADRAGLLACQDVNAATTALAKIAGLPSKYFDAFNVDDFVTQAREFEGIDASYDKLVKFSVAMMQDQIWTVMRAHEFLRWTDTGHYKDILQRKTQILQLQKINFCTNCGNKLEAPVAFCPGCGTALNT